ncbi:glycine cleavage system protein GcvH [bacterium]
MDLKFSKSHEWIKKDGDAFVIGITKHAVDELGDVVFVELPAVDGQISKGKSFGVVESVKAVSDLISPLSGKVLESNESLQMQPEMLNTSPYDDAWMIKVKLDNESDYNELLTEEEYNAFIAEEKKQVNT